MRLNSVEASPPEKLPLPPPPLPISTQEPQMRRQSQYSIRDAKQLYLQKAGRTNSTNSILRRQLTALWTGKHLSRLSLEWYFPGATVMYGPGRREEEEEEDNNTTDETLSVPPPSTSCRGLVTGVAVKQIRGVEDAMGTGAVVWDVAILMAQVLSNPSPLNEFRTPPRQGSCSPHSSSRTPQSSVSVFQGKTVVEIGAGTGFVGLVTAALGAKKVILSDVEVLLPHMEECVARTRAIWNDKCVVCEEGGSGASRSTSLVPSSPSSILCDSLWWGRKETEVFLDRHFGEEREERRVGPAVEQHSEKTPFTSFPSPSGFSSSSLDYIVVCECVVPRLYPIEPLVETLCTMKARFPELKVLMGYEHRLFPYYHPGDRFTELMLGTAGMVGPTGVQPSPDDHKVTLDPELTTFFSQRREVSLWGPGAAYDPFPEFHPSSSRGQQYCSSQGIVSAEDMFFWEFS